MRATPVWLLLLLGLGVLVHGFFHFGRGSILFQHEVEAVVALLAGIFILVMPRLLNYIVALYLIITGLLGLFGGAGSMHLH